MENKRRMRDSEDAAELNRGVVATSSFRQMRGGGFFTNEFLIRILTVNALEY